MNRNEKVRPYDVKEKIDLCDLVSSLEKKYYSNDTDNNEKCLKRPNYGKHDVW